MNANQMKTDIYSNIAPTRAQVMRGGLLVSVAQVAKVILMLLSQIVIARLLLPEDFGIVAMVMPVLGFAQIIADFGAPQIIIQTPTIRPRDLNTLFWRNFRLGLFLSIGGIMLSPLLSALYHEPRVLWVTIASASLIFLTAASSPLLALLSRNMRYGTLSKIEVLAMLIYSIFGISSAYFGLNYWSLVLAQFMSSSATLLFAWIYSNWHPSISWRRSNLPNLGKTGNDITTANLASYLNTAADNILVGAFLGDVALGLYDRAWKFSVQPLRAFTAPVGRIAIPTLSRLVDDVERYRSAFRQSLQLLLLVAVPALIIAVVLSSQLIEFALGQKWAALAPIFFWICFGTVISPLNNAIFWLFVSQGRTREQRNWAVITTTINICAYVLGLYWGVRGVAAVSAISTWTIQMPLLVIAATSRGPVRKSDLLRATYPFAVAGVAVVVSLHFFAEGFKSAKFVDLCILAAFGYAVFAAVLSCLSDGRSALATLMKAMPFPLKRREI